MKKTTLIFVLILSFVNVMDAQETKWHYIKCGVMDINNCTMEEFECLWGVALKNVGLGSKITGIGAASLAVGFGFSVLTFATNSEFFYALSVVAYVPGIIGILIGPPIWIGGAAQKSKLRKTPNYDKFMLGSLKVSPAIGVNQFNNSYNYGVTLSFTF